MGLICYCQRKKLSHPPTTSSAKQDRKILIYLRISNSCKFTTVCKCCRYRLFQPPKRTHSLLSLISIRISRTLKPHRLKLVKKIIKKSYSRSVMNKKRVNRKILNSHFPISMMTILHQKRSIASYL